MKTHTSKFLCAYPLFKLKTTVTYLYNTHTLTCVMHLEAEHYFILILASDQISRRDWPKCSEFCENIISALTNIKAVGHMQKKNQAHLLMLDHTVNTQRAGNRSCRLHSLEMRNMIHFLSKPNSHA